MNEFTNYKRFPIQVSRTTFALLHMYKYCPDHLEDICVDDDLHMQMCDVDFNEAADQFIKQFEGSTCRAFIDALKNRLEEYIKEDDEKGYKITQKYESYKKN